MMGIQQVIIYANNYQAKVSQLINMYVQGDEIWKQNLLRRTIKIKYTNEQYIEYVNNTKPIEIIKNNECTIEIYPPIELPTEETYQRYYRALGKLLLKKKPA